VSVQPTISRKAIPLCGIVLVLGMPAGCGKWGIGIDLPISAKVQAAQASSAQPELIALIQDFLKNVPANKRETYDRFFADDVIYTRNNGQVVTKKDILADTGNPSVPRANATFTGEDFTVHQYGDMAVVNFRLVMRGTENAEPVTRSFRNTGTFARRSGVWQAVAWQATPIAEKQ
jgi:ketosteroid isomerase-like protein